MHYKEYFLPCKAAQGRGYLWCVIGMCCHTPRTWESGVPRIWKFVFSLLPSEDEGCTHPCRFLHRTKQKADGELHPINSARQKESKSSSQRDPAADTSWNSRAGLLFILDYWGLKGTSCPVKILSNYRAVLFQLVFTSIKKNKINSQTDLLW